MISTLQRIIPKSLYPLITPSYRSAKRRLAQLDRFIDTRTLTEEEFVDLLQKVGFMNGAVVMVHSSMDELSRRLPFMNAVTLIQLMQQMVGEEGTLLMPTFPFSGRQVRYVEQNHRFDVRRSPSQAGLITEVFRRMPGVTRSLHPTHPVAAWGKLAKDLVATHHLGGTFGKTSPICKLRECGGIVAGLGTGLRDSFTILHVPEEVHSEAREHFLEKQPRKMAIIDGDTEIDYEFRVLRGDALRNYDRVENALARDGTLKYVSAGGLRCAVVNADRFIRKAMELIDVGRYL